MAPLRFVYASLPRFCLSTPLTWYLIDADLVVTSVRDTMAHHNLSGWRGYFSAFSSSPNWTVEAAPGGRRVIFTADPENIKAVLATQFSDYGKGKQFHDEWKDFLGDSIFTTDQELWHDSRQLIRPQFIKDRVSDLGIFEEHVQILIQQIKKNGRTWDGKQGKELDISDLFFRYTLDAATHFLLGRSVGSLEVPEQEFAEAFAEAQRVQNIIARTGYYPLHHALSLYYGTMLMYRGNIDHSTPLSLAKPSLLLFT